MKNTSKNSFLSVVVMLTLFMVGCDNPTSGDDEENGSGDDLDTGGTYTATINGEEWSATDPSVVFSQGGPYLEIKGNNPEAEFDIWITVPEDITEGTHALGASASDDPAAAVLVQEGSSSGTHYPDPEGELVIELHDTDNDDIKGTFNFEAKQTDNPEEYSVTDGSFNFDGEFYSE
ncbi:MAG: DUF6252 family protein [Alkalispirochaeta sp.]